MTDSAPTVIVYGATGFTGALVARALVARNMSLGLAGRDRDRLDALAGQLDAPVTTYQAELYDPEQLRAVIAGARVVVSCAGPFTTFGEPVVRAALHAGAHYLDITGEQAFMRSIYERYESRARRRGLCVLNAMAFEVALGDWAASLAAGALGASDDPLDEVTVAYAVHGMHPTRGTRLSALDALASDSYTWAHDRWDPDMLGADTRTIAFPHPFGARRATSFPSGEIITIPRHILTRRVRTYLAIPPGPLAAAAPPLARLAHAALRTPLGALVRRRAAADSAAPPPTPGQRAANDFAIAATARRGFHTARVCVTGADVYRTTAAILARGVQTLLAADPPAAGVLSPAQACPARASLAALPVTVTASFPLP